VPFRAVVPQHSYTALIAINMRNAMSGTDLPVCAKFQPNPFSSFGADASPTDRHADSETDRQTDRYRNSKLGELTIGSRCGNRNGCVLLLSRK